MESGKEKIILIDDDVNFSEALSRSLLENNWLVEVAYSGIEAYILLEKQPFDFILLDWNLPDTSGPSICKSLRKSGNETPIIFLTGRQTIDDKELALDSGADDFISKPFDVRELFARIRAIGRRPKALWRRPYEIRGATLLPTIRMLTCGNSQVQLTFLESAILEFLMRNCDTYFSAAQLFNEVWPYDSVASSDETVRVHMRLLRRKLAEVGCENLIITVRGSGYILRDKTYKHITKTNPMDA